MYLVKYFADSTYSYITFVSDKLIKVTGKKHWAMVRYYLEEIDKWTDNFNWKE